MSPVKTANNLAINVVNDRRAKEYKNLIDKVNKTFQTNCSQVRVNSKLNVLSLPSGVKNIEMTVYNVGQANFVQGIIDKNIMFLFDAGVPNSTFDKCSGNPDLMIEVNRMNPILENVSNICKMSPNYCFILHWHDDHIKGYYAMERQSMLNVKWIMPSYLGRSDASKARLSTFLKNNDVVYEISGQRNRKIFWLYNI